jgi:hypothetical protein
MRVRLLRFQLHRMLSRRCSMSNEWVVLILWILVAAVAIIGLSALFVLVGVFVLTAALNFVDQEGEE